MARELKLHGVETRVLILGACNGPRATHYAEVHDDLDRPKSRSKLCAGVFTGKSGRVFDHPWLEGR